VLNGAFREALKKNLLSYNPIDRVTLPAMRKFEGEAYTPDMAQKLLGRSCHKSNHVCKWADGRPFSPEYVSLRFKRILEKHGLPHIRFHELRHTAGSMLMERGMMAIQISQFLGHEKVATTLDIYGHLSIEGKKETATAMAEILNFAPNSEC